MSAVPAEYLSNCWPSIEAFMEGAAKHTYGRFTTSNIHDRIEDGSDQLWVAFDENKVIKGAVVTNIITYPQRKLLSMTFCGGIDLKEWKDPMLDLLRRYAKDIGCDGIEAVARKGWAQIFKDDGYKERWVTFELPL